MASKMTRPKFNILSFSLENMVQALSDSNISVTLVEISFFMPHIDELHREVE